MHTMSGGAAFGMVLGILVFVALGVLAIWGAIHFDRYAAWTRCFDQRMWGSLVESVTYPPILFRLVAIMQAAGAFGVAIAIAVQLVGDLIPPR